MTSEYETTVVRAGLALFVGAIVGAALIPFCLLLLPAFFDSRHWGELTIDHWKQVVLIFPIFFLYALFVFAVGIVGVGIPTWWLFHRLGWRSWRAGTILGFAATFLVWFGLNVYSNVAPGPGFSAADSGGPTVINGRTTAHGWLVDLEGSLLIAVAGAVAV